MGGVAEVEAAMAGGGGEEEGAGDDGLGPEVGERGVDGAFGEDDGATADSRSRVRMGWSE